MNNIVLPVFYQQKDNEWFIDSIEHHSNSVDFSYDINNIEEILNIIEENFSISETSFKQKQILYLIFSIFSNNNYEEPFGSGNTNGKPFSYDKYAFQGKYRKRSLGIYHAHISDENEDEDILIWYFTIDYNGEIDIHFMYMKHPRHYKPILKKIYSIEHGFNMDEGEFYENIKTILENNYVSNFDTFLKYLI